MPEEGRGQGPMSGSWLVGSWGDVSPRYQKENPPLLGRLFAVTPPNPAMIGGHQDLPILLSSAWARLEGRQQVADSAVDTAYGLYVGA